MARDRVETFFTPAERASADELRREVGRIINSSVLDTVMRTVGGMVAVLNAQRQILAANHAYLEMLGVDDAERVLGLRPGEAIGCSYADDHAEGCGAGRYCASCGAAIALTACQRDGEPRERECALAATMGGAPVELDLVARAAPLRIDGETMLVLVLRDISAENRRAALERAFFHDINNVVLGLTGASACLHDQPGDGGLARDIQQLAERLGREVELQRMLCSGDARCCRLSPASCSLQQTLIAVVQLVERHPACAGKQVEVQQERDAELRTDRTLLQRIVTNMLVNALEATDGGGRVRLWTAAVGETIVIHVGNRGAIPPPVALRVFQRYFSTKQGAGRGHGTYVMKMLAERLGGRVEFTTSSEDGTIFRLHVPRWIEQ
jgi:signal transduction histidine kinase